MYHDQNRGELYDWTSDLHEHGSLWDIPVYHKVNMDLLLRSFDATLRAIDYGPPRVMLG